MRAAAAARHLRPLRPITPVYRVLDLAFILRGEEAGPSASRVELGLGIEQLIAAADTEINALVMEIPVLAGKCPFGAFLARDFVLLGGQELFPFLVGLDDLLGHNGCSPQRSVMNLNFSTSLRCA